MPPHFTASRLPRYSPVTGANRAALEASLSVTTATISISQENLRRLARALDNLHARRVDGQPLDLTDLDPKREPVIELASDAGQIRVVPEPDGTRGYEDLRIRANHEPLGHGVRPAVASPAALVRMMEAHTRQPDPLVLETMRRVRGRPKFCVGDSLG